MPERNPNLPYTWRLPVVKNDYLLPIIKECGLYRVYRNGNIYTRKKMGGQVPSERTWRRAESGPAGSGRLQVRHNGKMVYAHRLVWFWFYGEIGDLEIDHKNNDKMDNSLKNLQRLTRIENQRKAERDGLITRNQGSDPEKNAKIKAWWSVPANREQMKKKAKETWKQRKLI